MEIEEVGQSVVRKVIEVAGAVQGVGFRPFVYRLANECNLVGTVASTPTGYEIEVQGEAATLDHFLVRLLREAPPQANISSCVPRDAEIGEDTAFRVVARREAAEAARFVPPDLAVCDECLREMTNARDRRFRYPFITCAQCGPRFTIARDVPFARAQTTMAAFRMCAACEAESNDPNSRRFRSPTNSCWDCGPQVKLLAPSGEWINIAEPVREAVRLLQQGQVVAVKGVGGFHLACDAKSESAVERLRGRWQGADQPFVVMVRRIEDAERLLAMDGVSRKQFMSAERPIVVLPRRVEGNVATGVAPRNMFLSACLPCTPLQHLLFSVGRFDALVMTSAAVGEKPAAIVNEEAVSQLRGIADALLVHDLEIAQRCDDSVAGLAPRRQQMLRRGRGFVPVPVAIEQEAEAILAAGAELSATVCVLRGQEAIFSQPLGDLENVESCDFFQDAAEHLQKILGVKPRAIAHDLHPDYFSTRWAQEKDGVQLVGVQHQHAHIAACMAENQLDGKVIGIALDDAGYGTDGALWGGEVLVADYVTSERAAHLQYFLLPGGTTAIREPWRVAAGLVHRDMGALTATDEAMLFKGADARKRNVILQMIERGVNTPHTSSCARLFEAVAALVGIRRTASYRGQGATELETAAHGSEDQGAYRFDLTPKETGWEIGTKGLIEQVVRDIRKEVHANDIARRFHNGIAAVFADAAEQVRHSNGITRVCLSGTCFQNVLLLELMHEQLRQRGFEVYTHSEVPTGDGGVSLGQAVVASQRIRANGTSN